MTHVEASYVITYLKKLMELNLKSFGFGYPLIAVLSKGKRIKIDLKDPLMLDGGFLIVRDGKYRKDIPPYSFNDFYINIFMLRIQDEEDAKKIGDLYKRIATTYDPDACVFFEMGLYNDYSESSVVTEKDMHWDPETIEVVSTIYYLKDDPVPRMSISPFINKGKREDVVDDSGNSLADILGMEGEELDGRGMRPQYEVLAVGSGWFKPYAEVEALIGNPYNEKR